MADAGRNRIRHYWYVTGMIGVALPISLHLPDTGTHGRMPA
jgi:hypothetical protein